MRYLNKKEIKFRIDKMEEEDTSCEECFDCEKIKKEELDILNGIRFALGDIVIGMYILMFMIGVISLINFLK